MLGLSTTDIDTQCAPIGFRKMKVPWSGPVPDFVGCVRGPSESTGFIIYLFIALGFGDTRLSPSGSDSRKTVSRLEWSCLEPQRNFNPERELELGILVIVSLFVVTELFKFRGIGRRCVRIGVAPESGLHPN